MSTASPASDDKRPTLHVIVSCKSRKTLPIPPELRMSSISGASLRDRVRQWTTAIEETAAPSIPAGMLYGGDHWKVVRSVANVDLKVAKTKVWIVSAGYGLVEFDTMLKPYSATFIRCHVESVVPRGVAYSSREWWEELAEWRPEPGLPRCIADVAKTANTNGDFVLLSLSEPYASALADDIAAASLLADQRLAVVCAGLSGSALQSAILSEELVRVLLPAESRLKNVAGLKGAMQGLNARIAHRVVMEQARWFPAIGALRTLMQEWLANAPPLVVQDNERRSDDEVRSFIVRQLTSSGSISRSKLLRAYRDSGLACEQSRFAALYDEVVASQKIDSQHLFSGVSA